VIHYSALGEFTPLPSSLYSPSHHFLHLSFFPNRFFCCHNSFSSSFVFFLSALSFSLFYHFFHLYSLFVSEMSEDDCMEFVLFVCVCVCVCVCRRYSANSPSLPDRLMTSLCFFLSSLSLRLALENN